jgi:hypothetical protein
MYNDLSKLKLNLMLVRKACIRVAFFLFLVYLVVTFMPWQGWLSEELSNVSLFGSALLLFLCVTMAFLEDEVQKIMNKSPFDGGLVGSGFNAMMQHMGGFGSDMLSEDYKNGMQDYTSEGDSDDLFAPIEEGSELEVEGSELKDDELEEDKDYWKNKLKSIPERTKSDFKERATALRDLTEKRFDLLRNEFLAHVFGTPEGDELPEGQDPLTFNPKAYHCGVYVSNVLLDMYGGEWLHYQNRLKTLFQDDYKIVFDDEGNVSYQLK